MPVRHCACLACKNEGELWYAEIAPTGRSLLTTKPYMQLDRRRKICMSTLVIFFTVCVYWKMENLSISIYMYVTCILKIIENGSVSNAKMKWCITKKGQKTLTKPWLGMFPRFYSIYCIVTIRWFYIPYDYTLSFNWMLDFLHDHTINKTI